MKIRTIRILIIEDETLTALRLRQILQTEQGLYEIVGMAGNAADALATFDRNKIDLVLADINIHGPQSGIDAARMIVGTYQTPLIFITAQKDDDTLYRASEVAYSGYIVKPFTADDVLTAVRLAVLKHGLGRSRELLGQGYEYDYESDTLFRHSRAVELTAKERHLLRLLIQARSGICTLEYIDNALWPEKAVSDATRRNLLFKVKQKLPGLEVLTHKGIGYQLAFD